MGVSQSQSGTLSQDQSGTLAQEGLLCRLRDNDEVAIIHEALLHFEATGQANVPNGERNVRGGVENAEGGSIFGGSDSDLQNYGNSVYSNNKEKLIRSIAEEVFKALHLHGSKYAQSAPISDVVSHLAKVVPNPNKGGKFNDAFNKSSTKQKEVCDAVANALNKHYGSNLIDTKASPVTQCQQVAEVMQTLFQGLHTEFMTIAGDVLRVLRNMQQLNEYIDSSYKKQKELVERSGNQGLKDQSESVAQFHERLKEELNRQMAMVSNMLNVSIGPTGKALVNLLEDNKEFTGMVRDVKADLGTSQFGQKLAYLLSGVSTVAHAAAMIEKSLKKLGMSVKDFKNAKNKTELRLKVYDHIQKKSPTSRELDKMMAAAEVIYKHDYNHNAVAKAMHGGGVEDNNEDDVNGGVEDNNNEDDVNGGVDDNNEDGVNGGYNSDEDNDGLPSYWSKKSLSKKINNKTKYREILLRDFKKLIKAHYQMIVNAANKISHNIGTTIQVSDDLDKFISVFGNLSDMNRENLHLALSGYPKDAGSKTLRESFMNQYNLVILASEPLTKGPNGSDFKSLQSAVKDTVNAIDNFSDKMVKAITEIHIDRPAEISKEIRGTVNDFFGSSEGGGGELGGLGSFVEFKKVRQEMVYRYRIANIKTNLSRTSEEIKFFGNEYETVLGEEAGWLISKIKSEYNDLIFNANPENTSLCPCPTSNQFGHEVKSMADQLLLNTEAKNGEATPEENKNAYTAMCSLWNRQRDAKIKMIEVAQAVDLYLRSFTDGIAKHPDSINSVVKMLDQVEIVAKWFNDRSGDNLAAVFEAFPSGVKTKENKSVYTHTGEKLSTDIKKLSPLPVNNNEHYYQWVETKYAEGIPNDGYLPGNPTLGIPTHEPKSNEKVKGLLNMGTKAVKSMRALENILSAFASVGSKFGDLNPQSQTFMNPGQIFNALCEYISCSSFTNSFTPGMDTTEVTAAIHEGGFLRKTHDESNIVGLTNPSVPTRNSDNYRVSSKSVDYASNYARSLHKGLHLPENSTKSVVRPTGRTKIVNSLDPNDDDFGILSGVSNEKSCINTKSKIKLNKKTAIAMTSIPDISGVTSKWKYYDPSQRAIRIDLAGWWDNFYDTDHLFQMTMKSIVCKVFTVVDAYRLFNRPTVDRWSHDSLNPLRTILGGADGGGKQYVKIDENAIELYLRLPLLAEWYRDIFGFKAINNETHTDVNEWKLSIVPSIDGIWSDFIRLIFDKASYVKTGNYTEGQSQKIIESINSIYGKYKNKNSKATVRNIMNSFVMEMNRVFGFLQRKEIKSYLDNTRSYLQTDQTTDVASRDYVKYDILDAEDQYGRNPAPSDRFVDVTNTKSKRKDRSMVMLQEKIEKLRKRMDVNFRKHTDPGNYNSGDTTTSSVSFVETLRNYKKEMTASNGDKEKYNIVLRMIQGTNRIISSSSDLNIMLHESVAAPLAVLYNMQKVLSKFNGLLHGTSLENLREWNQMRLKGTDGGVSVPVNSSKSGADAYKAFLTIKYKLDNTNKAKDNMVDAVYGDIVDRTVTGFKSYFDKAELNKPFTDANYSAIVRDQLSAVLDLCGNDSKLITYNVSSNGVVNVDFSHVEDACAELLQHVKSNLNKLRINFTSNHSMLDRYHDQKYPGSTGWLEEHLMQTLFKNRDETGLDIAMSHFAATLKHAGDNTVYVPENNTGGINKVANGDNSVNSALCELIYYGDDKLPNESVTADLRKFPFNVAPVTVDKDIRTDAQTIALGSMANNSLIPADGEKGMDIVAIPCLAFKNEKTLNKWDFDQNTNTLLLRFNDLVHNYLNDNLDDSTLKFHIPLIESFMNGAASREVIQNKAFPNVIKRTKRSIKDNNPFTAATNIGVPPANTVLFHSSAIVMRALANSIDTRLKKKRHVYESLAEIPEYMKDRMKTNLPYYSKLFGQVYERADLLRKLLSYTSLKNNNKPVKEGSDNQSVDNMVDGGDPLVDNKTWDTVQNTQHMIGLLNRLTELSMSIKRCSDSVYKELQDTAPYFMDLRQDFINDYKQRNGVMPLMPASHALLPQTCNTGKTKDWMDKDQYLLLLPGKANGSNSYKFNRAGRLLLARSDIEPQMDHMPGAKVIYNNYAASHKNSQINAQDYANTIKSMLKLCKFLNDGVSYGRLYSKPSVTMHRDTHESDDYMTSSVFSVARPGECDIKRLDLLVSTKTVAFTGTIADLSTRSESKTTTTNTTGGALTASTASQAKSEKKRIGDLVMSDFNPDAHGTLLYPLIFQFMSNNTYNLDRLSNVILNVENPNHSVNKEDLGKVLGELSKTTGESRERLRVFNILDMNIVPINVHAFMREVPFVNILNYAYTFDRMVHDFITPSYIKDLSEANDLMILPNGDVNNTRELMVKLLTNPYAELTEGGKSFVNKQYYALMASLFNGNDNMKLGRPRYLSDQLWHKVLLNSSVQLASGQRYASDKFLPKASDTTRRLMPLESGPQGNEIGRSMLAYGLKNPFSKHAKLELSDREDTRHNVSMLPNGTEGLKFWDSKLKTWRVNKQGGANMNGADVIYCKELGLVRFNTKLVRNLTWLVQLQRVMRVVMVNHLSWLSTPVVRGLDIADPKITEYEGNEEFDDGDFDTSNFSQF
jgi:hypothetical protein